MEFALQWIIINPNTAHTSILISTVSQSLCETISSYNHRTTSINQCISSISSTIFIQWMRGHSNIPGNDLADRAAKEDATVDSDTICPIPISCALQVINKFFCYDFPSHVRASEIYQHWDFERPTTTTKLQGWCTDRSPPFWSPTITKDSSSSDWPRNWA